MNNNLDFWDWFLILAIILMLIYCIMPLFKLKPPKNDFNETIGVLTPAKVMEKRHEPWILKGE